MKLRIRFKFIGILVVASLLPIGISMILLSWFGRGAYQKSQGAICQNAASQMASSINQSLHNQMDRLKEWIFYIQLEQQVATSLLDKSEVDPSSIQDLESRWAGLSESSPEVRKILFNPLANRLREFQARNPNFAELFLTDAEGRLIAATNKPSDYWQADEAWWRAGFVAEPGAASIEGVLYDESADSHSIDITLPLSNPIQPSSKPVGILKAVLNIQPFFQHLRPAVSELNPMHDIVMESGDVLSRFGNPALKPFTEKLPASIISRMSQKKPGWLLGDIPNFGPSVVGFAPIGGELNGTEDLQLKGLKPMWTMAYRDEATVMAPIEERLRWLSFWGLALGGGFILLGYYIASQKIIAPLGSLRQAAHAISQTVESAEENQSAHSKFPASRESNTLLQAVKAIRTGDEIEDLANEFRFMGQRILSYQEKLETKIAEKTEEIQRDLDFARQFQVNLMPQRYPEVPPRSKHPALGLNFHHVYRPASTVGGDFFNVLKLDDTKAGIFIADVMGHGARSALVTAIIATLLQEIEKSTVNPAEALELLNHHFYKVVHTTGDVLFVSAFYLILDLEAMTATYASAGHPSPLLLEQETGNVVELTPHLHNNPALGLFEHRTYELFQRPIKNRDVFLLFTDGLVEVMNSHDEEFGSQRLKKLIEANQREDLTHLADRMVDAAIAFAGNEGPSDDICLVGVEVGSMNAIH